MAEYKNAGLGVEFTIPDELTVREQLSFRSELFLSKDMERFARFWVGAQHLIEDWECELIPDRSALNLDTETSVAIADIVNWTGTAVAGHLAMIGAIPKND